MIRYRVLGTAIVLAHGIVATIHGIAHKYLAIDLSFAQKLFIISVITLMPLLALVLLWTRWFIPGATLLVFSMMGSLVFGLLYHFVIPSADHVLHLPMTPWRLPFQLTAVLLAIVEIIGCWLGARALMAAGKGLRAKS